MHKLKEYNISYSNKIANKSSYVQNYLVENSKYLKIYDYSFKH